MGIFTITVCETDVLFCGLDIGVTKEVLKGENIAAIAQIFNCKSVAKAINAAIGNVGACPKSTNHAAKSVFCERTAIDLCENEVICFQRRAGLMIFENGRSCDALNFERTSLSLTFNKRYHLNLVGVFFQVVYT